MLALPAQLNCPTCHQPLDGMRMVLATLAYAASSKLHTAPCPHCDSVIEYRAFAGAIEVGYTYWAGSLHFESVARLPVKGLRRGRPEGVLDLGGQSITPAGAG